MSAERTVVKLGNIYSHKYTGMNFAGNIWSKYGLSPALTTMSGGGQTTDDRSQRG